jgi:thiamine biosynthesis lipoprotein
MAKMFTDMTRHALNGTTMGTRWSALFHAPTDFDAGPVQTAMAAAVAEVDEQMSTWTPTSALMRLNATPPDVWVAVPTPLMTVLQAALEIGRASHGAFDIAVGDAVTAWGFGPTPANPNAIRKALTDHRPTAQDTLDLDPDRGLARKRAPLTLDLSGIAKGYGVDRLADIARSFGLNALLAIDGELRALGTQPDGTPWTVGIERPDHTTRAARSILTLSDAAIATSGDYRHWITVGDKRLSHTMDPARGGPLTASPASVTVIAETCMLADAWATALMVLGSRNGADLARCHNLTALFLDRDGDQFRETGVGDLFNAPRETA